MAPTPVRTRSTPATAPPTRDGRYPRQRPADSSAAAYATPAPGDPVALPSATVAHVLPGGALEFPLVPGTATWTRWGLPDQWLLYEHVIGMLGGIPGAVARVALDERTGLAAWRSDIPAGWEPNPVASRLAARLAAPGPLPGPVRGPLVICAWAPGGSVTPPLDALQLRMIADAHAHSVADRPHGGWLP